MGFLKDYFLKYDFAEVIKIEKQVINGTFVRIKFANGNINIVRLFESGAQRYIPIVGDFVVVYYTSEYFDAGTAFAVCQKKVNGINNNLSPGDIFFGEIFDSNAILFRNNKIQIKANAVNVLNQLKLCLEKIDEIINLDNQTLQQIKVLFDAVFTGATSLCGILSLSQSINHTTQQQIISLQSTTQTQITLLQANITTLQTKRTELINLINIFSTTFF